MGSQNNIQIYELIYNIGIYNYKINVIIMDTLFNKYIHIKVSYSHFHTNKMYNHDQCFTFLHIVGNYLKYLCSIIIARTKKIQIMDTLIDYACSARVIDSKCHEVSPVEHNQHFGRKDGNSKLLRSRAIWFCYLKRNLMPATHVLVWGWQWHSSRELKGPTR